MTGLNLHMIAGSALAFVNPWREFTFTKISTQWQLGSRTPVTTTESVTVQGKLQPANLQTLAEMGYTLREYQYYRMYLNLAATQLDKIRQLGTDTFVCEGKTYHITDKSDWQQNGWTEAYCYLDKVEAPTSPSYTAGEVIDLAINDVSLISQGLEYGTETGHAPLVGGSLASVFENAPALLALPDNVDHQEWEIIADTGTQGRYTIMFNNVLWLESLEMRLYSTNAVSNVLAILPDKQEQVQTVQGDFLGRPTTLTWNMPAKGIIIELKASDVNAFISGFKVNVREAINDGE